MEQADFMAAWGGVSGLQLALSVVWTEASARGHTLVDIARWMSAAPAALAGLTGKKGAIAAGCDADLVAFADIEHQDISPEHIHHRHKVTPYAGESLRGVVRATYLRGTRVADGGRVVASELGALL
jgi:allantoinase